MTGAQLEALARAKINLFLHVGTKRSDGYHALQSWVAFAGIGDHLSAAPADTLTLTIGGPFGAKLATEPDNLILAAARLLQEHGPLAPPAGGGRQPAQPAEGGKFPGAALTLTKSLPVASGIGGGSADAAAALHLLNELWALGLPGDRLMDLAASLGSDVPVCVYNRSAVIAGRGEIVQSGPDLPAIPVVLVNPGIAVPTADIFARLDTRRGVSPVVLPRAIADAQRLATVLAATGNDLEAPARAHAPAIGDVLSALRAQDGALLARMSGSGATCFALFADTAAAQSAAIAIKRARPNWWVSATRLDC